MTNKSYQRPPIPPINEYWDRPAAKDQGDENPNTIFCSVGRALSAWEMIETDFAQLFGIFVESHSKAAQRAYGMIISHSGRREVLIEAADIYSDNRNSFPKRDFDLLMKHLKDAGTRRNEIAHGMVTRITLNEKPCGHFLVPPPYNSRKTEAQTPSWFQEIRSQATTDPFKLFGHDYRYTSPDIDHFTSLFEELHKQTFGFHFAWSEATFVK